MSIFNPIDAARIEELLNENLCVPAAEALLGSGQIRHRVIRPLVVRCFRKLMEMATVAYANGQLEVAAYHSRLAGRLLLHSGEDAELAASIEASLSHQQVAEASDLEDLDLVSRLHQENRLQTAIDRIAPIAHLAQAKRLLERIEAEMVSYDRACQDCQDAINDGKFDLAEQLYRKANGINRSGTLAMKLGQCIKESRVEPEEPVRFPVISPRDKGVIFDFGKHTSNRLILFRHCISIGAAKRTSGSSRETLADLTINAPFLSGQHALILRHLRHGRMSYWLSPHPAIHTRSRVSIVREQQEIRIIREVADDHFAVGMWELQHGDIIRLSGSSFENSLEILFHLPKRNTAIQSGEAGTDCQCALLSMKDPTLNGPLFQANYQGPFSGSIGCSQTALMHRDLTLGSNLKGADLKAETPEGSLLRLVFEGDSVSCRFTGMEALCAGIDETELSADRLRSFTRLMLQPCRDDNDNSDLHQISEHSDVTVQVYCAS